MRSRVQFSIAGFFIWICFLSLGPVQGGKVLVVPVDASQWLSMQILVNELVRRGHETTVLVPESSLLIKGSDSYNTEIYKVPYTQAELDENLDLLKDGAFIEAPGIKDLFVNVERIVNYTSFQVVGCEALLDNHLLMNRLRREGFEVLLTDPFLPCGAILGKMFSIPTVYFLHGLPCQLDFRSNQCPSPPSFVPVPFSDTTPSMTFPQRVKNLMMYVLESHLCKVLYKNFDDLVSKRFGNGLTFGEILSDGAVWLLRYEFTLEWPRPLLPNMVLIGGINCAKKAPLPADLKEFVDGSGEDGFIVFTLGSLVPEMPKDKAKEFFDAFRQIPQRVVWRYTGVVPKDIPKNVRVMKWLPQNDLLAHPKAKVFMTHGGSHGTYEGICNAVPLLMFPLFGDQADNVFRMVTRGVAEKLSIFEATSEKLLASLNRLIHNKSYKERMVELSQIHLDRPVQPVELAAFWTEFVMRHKGAAHLRVAAHDLNWIQYHSLDVIGFLIVVFIAVSWLTLKCCLLLLRKCFFRKSNKKKPE